MDERRVLRRLNLRLLALDNDSFTTAAVLTYLPPTHRLSISYAGHEPAWYYQTAQRGWSRLETVRRSGLFDIPLAVDRKTRYTHCVRRVIAGDSLLMVTDGVLEAPSQAGELFGHKRLTDILQSVSDRAPQDQVSAIIAALREHTNGAPFDHDDVSILMIQFVDNLESSALWTALQNRLFRRRRRDKWAGGKTS
jgi:serine phosphatase RsbU (regulator of sigma subunit)